MQRCHNIQIVRLGDHHAAVDLGYGTEQNTIFRFCRCLYLRQIGLVTISARQKSTSLTVAGGQLIHISLMIHIVMLTDGTHILFIGPCCRSIHRCLDNHLRCAGRVFVHVTSSIHSIHSRTHHPQQHCAAIHRPRHRRDSGCGSVNVPQRIARGQFARKRQDGTTARHHPHHKRRTQNRSNTSQVPPH